ncbi:glycosyltransferase family 4 protein [Flavobacterium hungaricum]|uniref:Undecaprenyl/decaprenyl-phosphate alpha-N-acetylglucosaminyl 1-phosphate transferase n=1 Tax=Flavobacterium hungaricum TaxID=2082725 RepID=A0ABR9TMW5_9FLAO|nr:MraY family glycosyltransferase [Flavobacterium hungaricum]MBE8726394.1 undecaprenyl/decaprenyl-phosphate alpha-N-acetylglucosaminyl 1-phosphate transferase [Flavobacterium hungaricum]
MKIIFEFLSYGFLSLILTLIFIPAVKNIAIKVNLVDKPNYRKVHLAAVPLVGGISIALAVFTAIFVSNYRFSFLKEYLPILASAIVLLIVGVIDDKKDLSAKYKLTIQFLLALIIAFSGTRITSFYGVFGVYEIVIWQQYLVTILMITGVVNAFNLMDGVDGLIGTLSLLGFLIFLLIAIYFNDYNLAFSSTLFIGALLGFLRFNLSSEKIFMGDSGSLFIGFILISEAIKFLQKHEIGNKHSSGSCTVLLLILFFSIPVLDSLRVYMGRIKRGDSPFSADKSHLHHLFLGAGCSHKKTTLMISAIFAFVLLIETSMQSFLSLTIILVTSIIIFSIIVRILIMINNLHRWRFVLKDLENKRNSY